MKERILARSICRGIVNHIFLKLFKLACNTADTLAGVFLGTQKALGRTGTGDIRTDKEKKNEENSEDYLCWGKKMSGLGVNLRFHPQIEPSI